MKFYNQEELLNEVILTFQEKHPEAIVDEVEDLFIISQNESSYEDNLASDTIKVSTNFFKGFDIDNGFDIEVEKREVEEIVEEISESYQRLDFNEVEFITNIRN